MPGLHFGTWVEELVCLVLLFLAISKSREHLYDLMFWEW